MLGVCRRLPLSEYTLTFPADVEIHHLEKYNKLRFANVSVVAEGPLRASLKAEVKYGQSTINVLVCGEFLSRSIHLAEYLGFRSPWTRFLVRPVQLLVQTGRDTERTIASLKKNSRSFFRFDAEVDWHQRHEFLKCKHQHLFEGAQVLNDI